MDGVNDYMRGACSEQRANGGVAKKSLALCLVPHSKKARPDPTVCREEQIASRAQAVGRWAEGLIQSQIFCER